MARPRTGRSSLFLALPCSPSPARANPFLAISLVGALAGAASLLRLLPPRASRGTAACASSASPVRVDMAAAACTLVLHGWDQDAESSKKGCVPDDALARLIAAAGERPLAVNHARNVEPLTEVWDDLNEKVVERDRLPQPGPDGAVTEEMAKAIAEVKALERIVNAYQDDADVLPLVFVTFNSSKVAQRAASERMELNK